MLRLGIQGRWEPEDFIEVLTAVESLYYKIVKERHMDLFYFEYGRFLVDRDLRLDETTDRWNDLLLSRGRKTVSAPSRLAVARIEYASPGSIDFVGLGKALESIEGVIDRLIKLYTERNLRREWDKQEQIKTQMKQVELDAARESVRAKKIENAKEILALRKEYRDSDEDIMTLLIGRDQDRLIPLIAEGKLISVSRDDRIFPDEDGSH